MNYRDINVFRCFLNLKEYRCNYADKLLKLRIYFGDSKNTKSYKFITIIMINSVFLMIKAECKNMRQDINL